MKYARSHCHIAVSAGHGPVRLGYTICGNDIRRRLSIASFSFLPAFPTKYTTNRQEWWKGERRQHFNIVNMTKRNQSWHDIPSEAACLWTASPNASIFSKWSIKRPTPNPLSCLGGSPCLCVSFPNLIPFSSCKWLRPEACVYFCHCSDCNMCQSQSQYHTPAPSPSPLCHPLALPAHKSDWGFPFDFHSSFFIKLQLFFIVSRCSIRWQFKLNISFPLPLAPPKGSHWVLGYCSSSVGAPVRLPSL